MSYAALKGLNRNQIKYVAIIAMLIDHIAWGVVDPIYPLLGQIMHFIGRFTGPTMAFFVGQGYIYTRDVKKYQLRLGLCALASWGPFIYFEFGYFPFLHPTIPFAFNIVQGVTYTLFLGLTAIRVWESQRLKKPVKVLCVIGLCILSLPGDWLVMDVLGVLFVHVYRERPRAMWTAYGLTFLLPCVGMALAGGLVNSWFHLGVLLPILALRFLYNGQGGSRRPVHKWFFYVFYPAHLLALGLLRWT